MNKAIFLDRDGTLNREVDVLRDINQLEVLDGVREALARLKFAGYLLIIITNQPVIARGWLTEVQVEEINAELCRRIGEGIIDATYYCPHHPNANLVEYRITCECRKPNIGLITKAIQDFDIDTSQSYFVGDTTSDMLAGERAGLTTILVETGYAGKDGKYVVTPHHTAKDLKGVTELVCHSLRRRESRID